MGELFDERIYRELAGRERGKVLERLDFVLAAPKRDGAADLVVHGPARVGQGCGDRASADVGADTSGGR